MNHLKSYQLAKELYQEIRSLKIQGEIKDQLNRAALSICLNLSEGTGRQTPKDRRRFYVMALASLREAQCILDLEQFEALIKKADHLGACIWKLQNKTQ